MDCVDSYESVTRIVGRGTDNKGDYVIKEWSHEVPCGCHPESCYHLDGKRVITSKYKEYKDGSKVTID